MSTQHAGPGHNAREQYRTRAHAHGFPPDAFLHCVDDYAGATDLPWLVAADVVETQWLLEGPDHHAHLRRANPSATVDFTKLEELEHRMRHQHTTNLAAKAGLIEVLTAGIILGLGGWVSITLVYLAGSKALELFGYRGTAVLAALTGATLALAGRLGARA